MAEYYNPMSPIDKTSPMGASPMGASPNRFNPKVAERKNQASTDWAELVRYQQAMAEQMIQLEKEKRLQQKMELNEVLGTQVNQKQFVKQREVDLKQNDYVESVAAKQNFDQYLVKVKNDKTDFQKVMISEYDKEKIEKNENVRNKVNQDIQVEQRIVNNALDSLEREKFMNVQKKRDWTETTEQMLREKELQKRRDKLMSEQNRQEHLRLLEENARNLDMKELNYKLYYQRINDKQTGLQQVYDKKIAVEEKEREKHVDEFVIKGVYDAKRKAEEEEMFRQMKRHEQLQSTTNNVKSKIHEHDEEKYKQKNEYQNKVEQLRQLNHEMTEENALLKQYKNNQAVNYKSILSDQMREAEELKKKQASEMLNYEKKMHLENFDGLIPGIKSSKFDQLINPQMKTLRDTKAAKFQQTSLLEFGSNSPVAAYNKGVSTSDYMSPSSHRTSLPGSLQAPIAANLAKRDYHNPITNPMPKNVQNPYLIKEFHKSVNSQRTYLAEVAEQNLLTPGK